MKSLYYHVQSLIIIGKEFSKGRYLLYFIPGAILTIVYYFYLGRLQNYSDSIDLMTGYRWLDWGASYLESGITSIFGIFSWIMEQAYIFIIITVLSPFNTHLSEKLDTNLTKQEFKGNLLRFINDIIRMIFVVIIALVLELVFMLTYWILSYFLPDAIDPFAYFIIAAFFFGFSWYDFSLERYQKGVFPSLGFAFSKPIATITTGAIFLGIYNIPYVGILLSPVIAVMVSTIVYLYINKKYPTKTDDELTIKTETDVREIQ